MRLDPVKVEKLRQRGRKWIARCPACAEQGADKSGEHLFIAEDGRFGCIAYTGTAGAEHRKRIWELAGDTTTTAKRQPLPIPRRKPTVKPSPRIPPLRPLNVAEMGQIARLRGWHRFVGLQLLTNHGLLWFGEVFDAGHNWPAWIITDSTRRNAQARRLDGKLWEGIGNKKAKTLPGFDSSWPIGAPEIGDRNLVVLCEGQPDFCAALQVAWWEGVQVAPVCMTGTGNSIHTDALPYFASKHIRIATHNDPNGAGVVASDKWMKQLYAAGAESVDRIDFHDMALNDGQPVKDLADYATLLDLETPPPVSLLGGLTTDSSYAGTIGPDTHDVEEFSL